MDLPLLSAMRRNHAVEHATIAVLMERRGRTVSVLGFSDPRGFHLLGDFAPDEVASATSEALDRLQAGERHLAITPTCGTNIGLSGLFAGLAAMVVAGRDRRNNWPNALAAAMLAAAAAVPAGVWLQRRVTTDAEVPGVRVLDVRPVQAPVGPLTRVRLGR